VQSIAKTKTNKENDPGFNAKAAHKGTAGSKAPEARQRADAGGPNDMLAHQKHGKGQRREGTHAQRQWILHSDNKGNEAKSKIDQSNFVYKNRHKY
jgi:hypothetical protein